MGLKLYVDQAKGKPACPCESSRFADRKIEGRKIFLSIPALKEHPYASRPGGRMPSLHLTGREALDIVHFLLCETKVLYDIAYYTPPPGNFRRPSRLCRDTPIARQSHAHRGG